MSTSDPEGREPDRPRMVEALASLKEGLSDSDDPLYDGWKRRKGAGDAADNIAAASGDGAPGAPSQAQQAETPEPPPSTALTDAPAAISLAPPQGDVGTLDASPTQATVDTVPVRIIRYPIFPKWAVVVAVALVVFAASVVALRWGYASSHAGAESAVSVSASPLATTTPVGSSQQPVSSGLPEVAPRSPPAAAGSSAGARSAKPRGKDRKPKGADATFFRDPGF